MLVTISRIASTAINKIIIISHQLSVMRFGAISDRMNSIAPINTNKIFNETLKASFKYIESIM